MTSVKLNIFNLTLNFKYPKKLLNISITYNLNNIRSYRRFIIIRIYK